jgi:hypothetical protein
MVLTNQEAVKAPKEEFLLNNSNKYCTNHPKDNFSLKVTYNPVINPVIKHNLAIKLKHKVSQVNMPTQKFNLKYNK